MYNEDILAKYYISEFEKTTSKDFTLDEFHNPYSAYKSIMSSRRFYVSAKESRQYYFKINVENFIGFDYYHIYVHLVNERGAESSIKLSNYFGTRGIRRQAQIMLEELVNHITEESTNQWIPRK